MDNFLIYLILALIVIYNTYVTIALIKSELYSSVQKIYQTILIWLLPIVGAFIIQNMINGTNKVSKKPDSFAKKVGSSRELTGEADGD